MAQVWKKGRGKLGALSPLLGSWTAEAETPMGKMRCERDFAPFGKGYIRLDAVWHMGEHGDYREICLFGEGADGLAFWSFTNDGKRSEGIQVDGTDVHPDAVCFQAQMPAGLARFIYWPHGDEGFNFAVESKTKKGWNRFLLHHYRPAA